MVVEITIKFAIMSPSQAAIRKYGTVRVKEREVKRQKHTPTRRRTDCDAAMKESLDDNHPAPLSASEAPAPPEPEDCEESDSDRVKKYELLHQIAREVMSRELDRSKRKEESASRYSAVLSLFLALTGLLATPIIRESFPPRDALQWISLVAGSSFVSFMLTALVLTLAVLKHTPLEELFLKDEIMARVRTEPYLSFLHSLTLAFKQAIRRNRPLIDRRADYLYRAHWFVVASLFCLVASVVAAVTRGFVKP
jgi:hypothetical protein